MTDPHPHQGDDAPVVTSKTTGGKDAAAELGIDPKGDALVGHVVTINRPVSEVFAYFRDFANLPTFMENVERIDVASPTRSHWVVRAPAGRTVEWDAIVTEDEADRTIGWTSDEGADVPNSGRVTFADAGPRGTIVSASILYDPPAGIVGRLVAKMFQREPAIQARRDLRRFKQLMETGEVTTNARTRADALAEKE